MVLDGALAFTRMLREEGHTVELFHDFVFAAIHITVTICDAAVADL